MQRQFSNSNTILILLPTSTACSGSETYRIYQREAGSSTYTQIFPTYYTSNAGRGVQVSGLDGCTAYDFRIETLCAGAVLGTCEDTYETRGDCDCSEINAYDITSNSAKIALDGFDDCRFGTNNQLNFTIEWREINGGTAWNSLNIATANPFFPLSNLDACTSYEYRVLVDCNNIETSWCYGVFTTTCFNCNGVFVNNISDTGARVNWSGFESCRYGSNDQITFQLVWFEQGTNPPAFPTYVTAGNLFNIVNLDPCTTYEYQIRFECDGEWTDWCTGTFTTTGCFSCKGVFVNNITDTGARVNWSGYESCRYGSNNQITFQLVWFEQGTNPPAFPTYVTAGNLFNIVNLDPCTTYEYWIRFECDGVWTDWCINTFTTTGCKSKYQKLDATSKLSVSTYPNPFQNSLNIRISSPEAQLGVLELYDVLGRSVYREEVNLVNGVQELHIEAGNLPSGLLIYQLKTETGHISGPVTKQ